ncbi:MULTISPECIES: hypothetical protein [Nocardiopsis]|uniref:Uncharacterized protein n=1 Tax=Nocardiopsis sinuspersici TaxID=501010 RepID=A0A1V3BVM9_9ACTN|nr:MULTISPECIES: hypothetical protein [Nocardiopsis]OOC52432.1 hypothetical protein NOSIN_00105 [Nocardiopsis sinuspersici]
MDISHPMPAPPDQGRPALKIIVVIVIVCFAVYAVHAGHDVAVAVAAASALAYASVRAARRLYVR